MPQFLMLDLETTGLHLTEDLVIEIGAIALDDDFKPLAKFSALVPCGIGLITSRFARSENAIARDMHFKNGLFEELCKEHARLPDDRYTQPSFSYRQVQKDFCDWLELCGFERGKIITCGHSIATFDVPIIHAQLPQIGAWLSHRTEDYGGIGRVLRRCGAQIAPTPEMPHRALADCELELTEAQGFQRWLKQAAGLTSRADEACDIMGGSQYRRPGAISQKPETD